VDAQKVAEAITYLSHLEEIRPVEREMRDILSNCDTFPMLYEGEKAVLNPLMEVGASDITAFNLLVQHAYEKRKDVPELKRRVYSAEKMNSIRQRQYRALDLEELRTGNRPTGAKRKEYLAKLQARWAQARDEYVAAQSPASWHERNQAIAEFWQRLDTTLAASIADLRKKRGLRPTPMTKLLNTDDD
jgi:uncharacterized iron-regulated protein